MHGWLCVAVTMLRPQYEIRYECFDFACLFLSRVFCSSTRVWYFMCFMSVSVMMVTYMTTTVIRQ